MTDSSRDIQAIKNDIENTRVENSEEGNDQLREVLYRAAKLYMGDSSLTTTQAVELFAAASEKALKTLSKDAYTAMIGDILWIFGVDAAKAPERLARIGGLIKALVEKGIASEKVMKQTTEGSILEHAGLITSKRALDEITIRINTLDNFDQKYSFTFKDDPEGYSRLLTYLSFLRRSPDAAGECANVILSLIGKYDLCPQKVMYRIFESYDVLRGSRGSDLLYRNALFKIASELIPDKKPIMVSTITKALCHYAEPESKAYPQALIDYTGKLIADGTIELDDVWPCLLPSDDDAQKAYERFLKTVSTVHCTTFNTL